MMETLTRLWRRAPQPAVLQLARSRDSDWAASALPQARRRALPGDPPEGAG